MSLINDQFPMTWEEPRKEQGPLYTANGIYFPVAERGWSWEIMDNGMVGDTMVRKGDLLLCVRNTSLIPEFNDFTIVIDFYKNRGYE